MMLARLIIHLSSALAPRAERARLKEEWLAELDAASARGAGAALRFAIGAPADALAHRGRRDDAWSARERVGVFSAVGGDIRYAWRQLVRRPLHSLAVVGCLIVGLVVSIGTFSVIQSLTIGDRPGVSDARTMTRLYLKYDSAERVPGAGRRHESSDELSLNEFMLTDARHLPVSSVFTSIGVEGHAYVTVTGNHGPVATLGAFASGDFFKVLGTERGAAGRLLQASDDEPNAPAVAVVTDHFWRTHLDATPDAIGRPILITGMSFTVIGVAPPRFHGFSDLDPGEDDSHGVQVWVPVSMASRWKTLPPADEPWLTPVARMKRGVSKGDAERELSLVSARIAAANPNERSNAALLLRSQGFGPDTTPGEMLTAIFMVMLLPLTILAIGCANVANLQLARVAERSRELAVRLSLGASRGQLIRLLTLETLARAFAAVAVSLVALQVLMRYFQTYFPIILRIDARVALFAIGLATAVALGTGLMPAWMVLRKTAAGQLKQSAQSGGLGHSRMRATLIVAQVALSLALLTTATLIVRTTTRMAASAPPVLREQVVASFNPSTTGMTPEEGRRFADTLAERAAIDGRVRGVAVSSETSLDFGSPQMADNGMIRFQRGHLVGITPSWLDVNDVKLMTGRRLTGSDDDSVALLSARAAEMVAPSGSALGEVVKLQLDAKTTREVRVIGIVADNQTQPRMGRPDPVVYTVLPKTFPGEFVLRMRTSNTEAVSADLPKLVTNVDPRITWTSVRRGDMRFQDEAKQVSVVAMAVAAAGTVALILSATGLFAVMSYIVTLRRREIGVRLAIGADPRRIVALVMRQATKLVAIGAAVGMAIAVPVAFAMRAQLSAAINPSDPMIFAPALALLFTVGAIAAALPALRASRVDPISTLRQD
jgi:predicted permease